LLLSGLLDELAQTQCRYLNISLDSLDRNNFLRITRRDALHAVLDAILRARDLGFYVKVNAVALRSLNDHEVLDFVDWSGREQIPVRFLEAMNIGVMRSNFTQRLITARELIATIRTQYILRPKPNEMDATAYSFTADNGADIGFIASESEPFCGGCSRLRLTPKGHIRPCLFKDEGIDLKPLALEDYPEALARIIRMKPIGRIAHVAQPMYQIGG
jgi:cyclic pyranopterin phosphate synthase